MQTEFGRGGIKASMQLYAKFTDLTTLTTDLTNFKDFMEEKVHLVRISIKEKKEPNFKP